MNVTKPKDLPKPLSEYGTAFLKGAATRLEKKARKARRIAQMSELRLKAIKEELGGRML